MLQAGLGVLLACGGAEARRRFICIAPTRMPSSLTIGSGSVPSVRAASGVTDLKQRLSRYSGSSLRRRAAVAADGVQAQHLHALCPCFGSSKEPCVECGALFNTGEKIVQDTLRMNFWG